VSLNRLPQEELRLLHYIHVTGPTETCDLERRFDEPCRSHLDSLRNKGLLKRQGPFWATTEVLQLFSGAAVMRGCTLFQDSIGWVVVYLDGTQRAATDVEVSLWNELKTALQG
jgi:hypothetical protein